MNIPQQLVAGMDNNTTTTSNDTTTGSNPMNNNNSSNFIERSKIILMGDSLTQLAFEGWGNHIANVYQRRADVLNRGCSGYNTKFYSRLLNESTTTSTVDNQENNIVLVTIWFGANDASIKELNPHHYVSIDEYKDNLKGIVEKVQTIYHPKYIMLITPPPVVHEQRYTYQKQRYGDKATGILERTLENAGLYATACCEVGKEINIPCCDMYNLMLQEPTNNWETYFYDGLHFSKSGHDFVGKQLIQFINTNFPNLQVVPDPVTGQYNNSSSICSDLVNWGFYHDHITNE